MFFRYDRGSALVIALLVTFILSLLGVSFLLMAQTESRIAYNERNALQAFYIAEAGASVVQGWFDRPGSEKSFPAPEIVRRTQREVLDESDPYEGATTAGTQYKQVAATSADVDLDGDGVVDLFRPPYRGGDGFEHALMGTEDAPDLLIDDADPDSAVMQYLTDMSVRLFGDTFNSPGLRGRISRIAIYAPPYVPVSGAWTRYGLATVEVTARVYRLDTAGRETTVRAERTVKMVLNEIPYSTPVFGPLHACKDLKFSGQLSAHWGAVTTCANLIGFDPGSPNIPTSLPRSVPSGPRLDRLWVYISGKENCVWEYNSRATGDVVEDPWMRVIARESIDGAALPDNQPYPSPPGTYPDSSCDPGSSAPLVCCDRSSLFQNDDLVLCPEYDYEFWKNVGRSGRSDVHYYVFDEGSGLFLEHGMGDDLVSFETATSGKTGLFFFDTADGLAPHDDDLDGTPDNLTPYVEVSGNWQSSGFIYINAEEFRISGPLTPPQKVSVRAPGEPILDGDFDRLYDAGEAWVNLLYPTNLGDPFRVDAGNAINDNGGASGTGPVRNSWSPYEFRLPVSFSGVVYTGGDVVAEGAGVVYGSVIAKGKITLGESGSAPDFYWDERIFRRWPPMEEDHVPRVAATRWGQEP